MADIGEAMNVAYLYRIIGSNTLDAIESLRLESFMYKLEIERTFNTKQYNELIGCIGYVIANRKTYKDLITRSLEILNRIVGVLGDHTGKYRENAERVIHQVHKLLDSLE